MPLLSKAGHEDGGLPAADWHVSLSCLLLRTLQSVCPVLCTWVWPLPIYELCLGRSLQGWLLACCTKHAWKHAAQHAADMSDSLVLTCRAACPVCHTAYEQQAVDDPVRRETNPIPKWPVPFEVIEWQPSYTQKVTCSRLESQALLPGSMCPSLHCYQRGCPQLASWPIHGAGSLPTSTSELLSWDARPTWRPLRSASGGLRFCLSVLHLC